MRKPPPIKRYRWIALVIIMLIIAAGVCLIVRPKNRMEQPDFIARHLSGADSLISTMSLEEKISRLLLVDIGERQKLRLYHSPQVFVPGGLMIRSDSAELLLELMEYKQKSKLPPLFFCEEQTHFHPVTRHDFRPHIHQILALNDSALFRQIVDDEIKLNRKFGIDVWMLPVRNANKWRKPVYDSFVSGNMLLSLLISEKDTARLRNDSCFSQAKVVFVKADSAVSDDTRHGLYRYLKDKLNFNGILVVPLPDTNLADALKKPGADMYYAGGNYLTSVSRIRQLVDDREITEKHIDRRLRRLLALSIWRSRMQYDNVKPAITDSLAAGLNRAHLFDQVRRKSIVLLNNPDGLLPLKNANPELRVYSAGAPVQHFNRQLPAYSRPSFASFKKLRHPVCDDDIVLVVINACGMEHQELMDILHRTDSLMKGKRAAVVIFDQNFRSHNFKGHCCILHVQDTTVDDQRYAAQCLFAGQEVSGRVPPEKCVNSIRYHRISKSRLGYASPAVMKLDTAKLNRIDSIVHDAIEKGAFPGCQVFMAYKGDVIINKSYGHHTYARRKRVKNSDVYDLASITKVAATTLAAMHLVQKGKLNLDEKLGEYFKDTRINYTRIKPDTIIRVDTITMEEFRDKKIKVAAKDTFHLDDSTFVLTDTMLYRVTSKNNIFKCTMRDILIHKSGLPPSLPILRYLLYRNDSVLKLPMTFVLDRDSLLTFDSLISRKDTLQYLRLKYYNNKYLKDTSDRCIAAGMYLRREYCDTLWMDIKQTRVFSKDIYMYSDLNAVLAQITIDTISGQPLEEYVFKNFYKPMGLDNMGFHPLYHLIRDQIIPTESDKFWRMQTLHGDVHDPSAALMGGMAGNAGLFSCAEDLGVLFQMILQGGIYGGRHFLSHGVINSFVRRQKRSHRGLGFDRVASGNIAADSAPPETYGHTGFTGTCVWVDPLNELVYVFLSNRVHPSARNWRINKYRVRQNVHQAFYDAMAN